MNTLDNDVEMITGEYNGNMFLTSPKQVGCFNNPSMPLAIFVSQHQMTSMNPVSPDTRHCAFSVGQRNPS